MDVGWGELMLLAVVALVIFGPEKLPGAAAEAGRMVKKLRELAASAQKEVQGHGVDVEGIKNDLRGISDLHPKRIISSALAEPQRSPARPDPPGTQEIAAPTSSDSADAPQRVSPRLDPDAT